jgi:hypothetical protein
LAGRGPLDGPNEFVRGGLNPPSSERSRPPSWKLRRPSTQRRRPSSALGSPRKKLRDPSSGPGAPSKKLRHRGLELGRPRKKPRHPSSELGPPSKKCGTPSQKRVAGKTGGIMIANGMQVWVAKRGTHHRGGQGLLGGSLVRVAIAWALLLALAPRCALVPAASSGIRPAAAYRGAKRFRGASFPAERVPAGRIRGSQRRAAARHVRGR